MEIRAEHRVLDNGLSVLVHEDHTCPVVAVNVWYHVGSKDERPGRTGLAHLFEHLMFEGSEHHDSGYFQPLQAAGALLNGSTNTDRTNYWEVVPTGALELALWLESDRMGYLLPALTEAKFANQRDVVLNERRQNYENRPYGLAAMATVAALFPPDHPYHWLTIGAPEDLRAATLDEVRAFFASHYHPGNASLAIAGAIAPAQAFALAERYFGEIPAGPANATPVLPAATLHGSPRAPARGPCRAAPCSIWPGIHRRCSRPTTPSSTWSRICSPAGRCHGCIAASSMKPVSPPKWRPSSSRARRQASSRSSRLRRRVTASTRWSAP